MADVIDFNKEHDKRHGPTAENVWLDPLTGKKWFRFVIDFKDGDNEFSFHIWALDMDDAQRRLELIKLNAVLAGQVYSGEPA